MCLSSAACELPQCITHAELHPSRETRWTPRPLRRRSWKPPSRRPWRASGTMSRSSGTSPCRTALRPSRSGPSAATDDAPWARGSTSGPGSARLLARGKYPSCGRGQGGGHVSSAAAQESPRPVGVCSFVDAKVHAFVCLFFFCKFAPPSSL